MQPELRNVFLDIPYPSLPHAIADVTCKMELAPHHSDSVSAGHSLAGASPLLLRYSVEQRSLLPPACPSSPQTCCVSSCVWTGPQAALVHSLERPKPRTESAELESSESSREMFLSKSLRVQQHITKDIFTITFKKNLLRRTRILGMKVIQLCEFLAWDGLHEPGLLLPFG